METWVVWCGREGWCFGGEDSWLNVDWDLIDPAWKKPKLLETRNASNGWWWTDPDPQFFWGDKNGHERDQAERAEGAQL